MKSNYTASLERVLQDEGGYTNDATDPGGPTNFGITIHDYRMYINPKGTATDVKNMTVDQAKVIYKARYWDAVKGDDLPAGIDYVVFDYGVNSGVSRSAKVLQKLVNVPQDGEIGPDTIAAVKKQDPKALVNAICDERMTFLKKLKTFKTFGKGWTRRVEGGRAFALSLITAPATTTGGGVVVAGGGAAAAAWWPEHAWQIAAGVAGALTLIGLIYWWYKVRIQPRITTNV